MPSMDFIYDIIDCLSKEKIDYLILTIRDGKEKDKVDLMKSALFVSNEILEGWKGISSKVA